MQMHSLPRIGVIAMLALGALPGSPARATHEGTAHGAGVCREKNCPCTEEQLKRGMVDTPAGCCDKKKLDALLGRLRALREAAAIHRRDFNELTRQRDEARDELWGKGEGLSFDSGSIVDFGKAGTAILASFGGVGATINWINNGVSIATAPKSTEEWGGAGLDLLDSELFKSLEWIRSSERANAAASLIYRNRNYPAMREVYRREFSAMPKSTLSVEGVQTTARFLAAVQAVYDLAKATDAITEDLSDYLVANKEAMGLQKELDKIDGDIDRTLKEIARLRKSCPGVAPGSASSAGDSSRPLALTSTPQPAGLARREAAIVAVSLPVSSVLAAAAGPQGAAEARKLEFVLKDLTRLRQEITRVQKRFEERIFDPLSPWLIGTWKKVKPAMLVELARMARPDVIAFSKDLERLLKRIEGIRQDLGAARPYRRKT